MHSRTNQRSAGLLLALLFMITLQGACRSLYLPQPIPDPSIEFRKAHAEMIERWHQERWNELNSESGWLTLVGLFWLKDGRNACGSEAVLDIVLPKEKVPPQFGEFTLLDGRIFFQPLHDEIKIDGKDVQTLLKEKRGSSIMRFEPAIELKSDAEDKPTLVTFNSLTFQIIKRGDKLGLRVRDSQNPDRLNFKGTQFYPTDVKWSLTAQFEPYNPPKPMPITNVLGMESAETSPGAVKFQVDGREYQLDAVTEKNEPRIFMIFADQTSGKDTYPAGRYLYINPPDASGRLFIDFNKAYSPPCAFTRFATCPLPPKQNRLPIAIEAGEKYERHAN